MVAPAVIAAGITAAGSLASALASKKKAPKTPDYTPLINQVNAATTERKRLAGETRAGLAPINQEFGDKATDLSKALLSKTQAAGSQYIDQASNAASLRGKSLTETLRQDVLDAQPDINQNLRESLAATGGLQRGSATSAFREQATKAGSEIARGSTAIRQDELASRQKALDTVFNTNQETLLKATGLDYDTIKALASMGRDDLIAEAAELAAAETDRANAMIGITQNRNTADLASQAARNQNRADLNSALIGSGTNLLTTMLTKRNAPATA